MSYSIIIPTMYYHVKQLREMLAVYNSLQSVGEILIINNNEEKRVNLDFDKVRVIGDGVNKFVNPSWRYGVENANCENIILANDDITIIGDVDALLETVSLVLTRNRVVGPSKHCYPQFGLSVNEIRLRPSISANKLTINYGFGVFMFMKKEVFQNTKIPNEFKVWYGDHFLYLRNTTWEYSGVEIMTAMRGTTSKLNLQGVYIREKNAFERLKRWESR